MFNNWIFGYRFELSKSCVKSPVSMSLNLLWSYLDHNATTPVWGEMIQEIPKWLNSFGNPSSIHQSGRAPKNIIREARKSIAEFLGVSPLEIIFNSGASEGNNTVIKGFYELLISGRIPAERNEFMCSLVEHPSVIKSYKFIESKGLKVHWIPVSQKGSIDLAFFREKLSSKIGLVSVMGANNETGNIFPIKKMAQETHEVGAFFHCDSVQLIGKTLIEFLDLNVDYATFSGHKFYALKGTGFLYVKKKSPYQNLIDGGAQERSRRGGTENTLGIASLGYMLKVISSNQVRIKEIEKLRNQFEAVILNRIDGVKITGIENPRLVNTSHMTIEGIDGETLLMNLDLEGFHVSTGAACSSGNPEPSPVLLNMGFTRDQAQSSLRVSLGWGSSNEEIERFSLALEKIISRLREIKHGQKYFNDQKQTSLSSYERGR